MSSIGVKIENETDEKSKIIDHDSSIEHTVVDWQPMMKKALMAYNDTNITNLLDHCYQGEFVEQMLTKPSPPGTPSKEKSMFLGTILHDYIARFYKKFNNREKSSIVAGADHVRDILAALKSNPLTTILWDQCVNRFHPDSRYRDIHFDFRPELIQFYKFVCENSLVNENTEVDIQDRNHNVRGRYNATFRVNGSEKDLLLYDWTRSLQMTPGSISIQRKTLQLNIYKYILEKYYDKNIVKMYSVIFHRDMTDFDVIEIENIGFHCDCAKCQLKIEKKSMKNE